MMLISVARLCRVVGGSMVGDATAPDSAVEQVVTDSRRVLPGTVFVAIKGERVDGHDFLDSAARDGAVAAIVDHEVAGVGIAQIVVPDTVEALGDVARASIALRRDAEGDFTVIGITGSVGKTTTKDMLHAVLSTVGETVAPVGSFNNEIGLPLTALRVGPRTRFLIAEMGANHGGEIAHLTSIVPPDISVVLKVGVAHLGEFGSVERIAQAKSEIVRGLVDGGTAVLNAGDSHVAAMAAIAPGDVLWFRDPDDPECSAVCDDPAGSDDPGDGRSTLLSATDVRLDGHDRPSFTLDDGVVQARVRLAIPGRHNVVNALAAATVARHVGVGVDRIAAALSGVEHISPHRMAVSRVVRDGAEFTLIDDSFNANPDSMRAGLDGLARWGDGSSSGPSAYEPSSSESPSSESPSCEPYRIAVLGAMLELGADEDALHRSIGRYAVSCGADAVIAVGNGDGDGHLADLAGCLAQGAREAVGDDETAGRHGDVRVAVAEDSAQADTMVMRLVRGHPGSVVLLKGSHASGLSALASSWTVPGTGHDTGRP
jgi:UDP-N-acetylmuramoyl-tripeptide--D-alanyl-D-alanine ligase